MSAVSASVYDHFRVVGVQYPLYDQGAGLHVTDPTEKIHVERVVLAPKTSDLLAR